MKRMGYIYDFYSYNDIDSDTVFIKEDDSQKTIKAVKDIFKNDITFVPNGDSVDIMLDGVKISSFIVPDEAAFENATYDSNTKEITFTYDKDGVEGQQVVNLSDLSDKYSGEGAVTVDSNNNISLKLDSQTMKINDEGELETISDNVWGTIE